ncbi:MAG: putative amidohydrolase YtcJ [Candidatus Azotimanducaceae bacterium]
MSFIKIVKPGVVMRVFFAIVISSLLLSGCTNISHPNDSGEHINASGDLLLFGGTILTMDARKPVAEAMLVSHGRIRSIGNLADMEILIHGVKRVDLKGATVLPGFIDSHAHVRELGTDTVKADLVGATDVEEMVRRLKLKFPKPVLNEWLLGQGWDEGEFASRGYPDRMLLDKAFPNNPVMLESLHGFGGFVNGKAFEIVGITRDTPDPDVGEILRREDGEPTGVLLTLAQQLVTAHIPELSNRQLKEAIVAGLSTMASAGVTSVHEAGMNLADVTAYQQLAEQSDLPIRVYGLLNGNDESLMTAWFKRGPLERRDAMFEVRSIKVFYDGSLGSRTAMLREPYSDHPEKASPTERITPKAVNYLAERAAKYGFQMAVHAIGDEGNDRTIGIYERALSSYPSQDHRWRVEHAQVVLPDYFSRVANAGFISSMQSSHAVGDSGWAEDRVGSDRIQYAYAWQKVLNAGGRLIINSDLPGEPWRPTKTLYFAVNRMKLDGTPSDGWYPDEALSVEQALKAMTIEGAYSAFQERHIGSLELGKFGDFVILDTNPLLMAKKDLASINVLATYVAGRAVYSN